MSDQEHAIIRRASVVLTFWAASIALGASIGAILGALVKVVRACAA